MKEVKVAIVGFGGIARAHAKGYKKLADEGFPVKVVALCDVDPNKFEGEIKINLGSAGSQNFFTDVPRFIGADALLEAGIEFDMADICVPDYLHKELTIKLLAAGKHVLCEKPMALNTPDCLEMIEAAKKAGTRFMVGQCLRFAPEYVYLKKLVDSGEYGKPKSIFMNRFSISPTWGFEDFFRKTEGCGGSIMNLHIHDIDVCRFMFGEPKAVSCISYDADAKWAMVNSRLLYDGFFVVANSSFDEAPKVPFLADFRVRFEGASVIKEGKDVKVYPVDGEPFTAELEKTDGYTEEIRYIASLILDEGKENDANPPESAAASVRLIELLRESSALGGAEVAPDIK